MTSLKEAAQAGISFVADLFPDARDLRLEEVASAGTNWKVVISFRPEPSDSVLSLLGEPKRIFKEVEVREDNGEATALKVWKS